MIKAEINNGRERSFGDIKIRKYNLMDFINQLDVKEETYGLSNEELEQRKADRDELAEVVTLGMRSLGDKSQGHCSL